MSDLEQQQLDRGRALRHAYGRLGTVRPGPRWQYPTASGNSPWRRVLTVERRPEFAALAFVNTLGVG